MHCRLVIQLTVALLAFLPPGLFAQASAPDASARSAALTPSEQAEQMWAMRRAQAQPIDFYMPFYTLADGTQATVFLMNPIADTISVAVTALDGHGGELPLGTYTIESRHHIELSLAERLRGFEPDFGTGSLRLSLLGDADTLQGWTILSTPTGDTFELPIANPSKATGDALYAFWDTTGRAPRGAWDVRFELLNVSTLPRRIEVTTSRGQGTVTEARVLAPGERLQLGRVDRRPFAPRGWAELRHDGDPGDILAVGMLSGRAPLASIPLVGLGEADKRHHYESIPLPHPATDTRLTLFRPGAGAGPVRIEAIDAASGAQLAETSVPFPAGDVRTLSLDRILPSAADPAAPVRLRIVSDAAPLLVQGFSALADGTASELMFFPRASAHGNGTYPLPDPARYATATTIVNLSEEPSCIVAQVTWAGGTYALGPLDIPAGAAHRIDLEALTDSLEPDLVGRELSAERPEAVLKWSIIEGGGELVARTEVTPHGHQDRFGFNCWGCCWQTPEGRIVPPEVEFTPGQERGFTASVLITDCAGTMGPYPTTPTSMTFNSPFSWDGRLVTASSAADGDLSFEDQMTRISPTCASIWTTIFGWGKAKLCKETFNPLGFTTLQPCGSQTASCFECTACCNALYQMRLCQGKNAVLLQQELQQCLGICSNDHICNQS